MEKKRFSTLFLITIIIGGLFLASALNFSFAQRNPNLFTISGCVLDCCRKPVAGASIYLVNGTGSSFGSGCWSSLSGLYCIVAPAGVYRIVAKAPSDWCTSYSEAQIEIYSDITKNITLVPGFQVSGYVLDSSGKGVAGASTSIYNSSWSVPSTTTRLSGFYSVYLPAGNYTFTIWPPENSNLVNFQSQNFTITSDMTYNIVLDSGFKVSGNLTFPSGEPVSGLATWLTNSTGHIFSSGRWSNSSGYYYNAVPAGTYSLFVKGLSGSGISFSESNIVITSDITKNITIPYSQPSPE